MKAPQSADRAPDSIASVRAVSLARLAQSAIDGLGAVTF
jgi:hypothetical protein